MAAPKALPRSWWANSDWPRGGARLVGDDLWRLGNVNHYPGRDDEFGRLSLEDLRRNIRGWWDYHVNTRGWSDIGYQTAIALTEDGPVMVDLRGIGRVPAAHASASNPYANWHGGATLWLIGNTEPIDKQLINAYRYYRHNVWLPRWPNAILATHHRRVPGAQTLCAGDHMEKLVRDGKLLTKATNMTVWNEDLTPDTPGNDITPLAHKTLPDGYGRHAADLLGYAAAGGSILLRRAELLDRIANTDGVIPAPATHPNRDDNPHWKLASYLDQIWQHGDQVLDTLADLRIGLERLENKIDALATRAEIRDIIDQALKDNVITVDIRTSVIPSE